MWAGLGYYRRAKHLHAAAKVMTERFAGQVPPTAAQLRELPGVGRYTAGAVASIAFGERVPVLDGNVMRVLSRVRLVREDIAEKKTQDTLWAMAEELVSADRPGDFNQALMELGATVCVPGRPACMLCPISAFCKAFEAGVQGELPVKKAKGETPTVKRVAAVVWRGGAPTDAGGIPKGAEVLIMQRPAGVVWERMWEFPCLDMEEDEPKPGSAKGPRAGGAIKKASDRTGGEKAEVSDFNWLARIADVIRQRLGIRVGLDRWCGTARHQLTHRTMEYRVVRGRGPVTSGGEDQVRLPPCDGGVYQAYRWVRWSPADLPVGRVAHKIAEVAGVA
jgi:A/G-specific adenine glycosylase